MIEDLINYLFKLHITMKVQLMKTQEQQETNADAYCKE